MNPVTKYLNVESCPERFRLSRYLLVFGLCVNAAVLQAAEIRVAVASNFKPAMLALVQEFESNYPHSVLLSFGSTGKHYAQIVNGAPFDLFFAADSERPQLLEQAGSSVPNTRFSYAVGELLLWSPQADYVDRNGAVLARDTFRYLAIANPKLAPYGRAAQQVLQQRHQWQRLQSKLVRGENINQALLFVQSGNAELGMIARSQWQLLPKNDKGSIWQIPQELYSPITQQVVMLKDSVAGRELLEFMQSDAAQGIIRRFGYRNHTPSEHEQQSTHDQ